MDSQFNFTLVTVGRAGSEWGEHKTVFSASALELSDTIF
jgi:hypothetical protein